MDLATIGKRIRTLRKAREMTVLQLAEKAGVHENTVRNAEYGRLESMQLRTLARIADALGVETVALTIQD